LNKFLIFSFATGYLTSLFLTKSLLVYQLANDNIHEITMRIENMAANLSKITALASTEADNSNNGSKQPLESAKEKQEKEGKDAFEQFQADFFVQNPKLVSLANGYNKELEPFSSIFPLVITNLTISYMREREIPQLAAIASPILFACSRIYEIMSFKKLVSEKLLLHVFNANPDGIDAFLRTAGVHPKILLTESHYAEGYQSKKLNKFVCFRQYKTVSALVGAYRCGDFRFGRRILALLLRDNNLSHEVRDGLLCEARLQLSELLDRIGTPMDTETANIKTSAATNMAMTSAGVTSIATTASAATAVGSNDTAGNKEKTEFNSDSSANTHDFADDDEFLSAIVKLINAYNAYISQYDSLANQKNWKEINRLWGEVGECQKLVYHYVKLEFFGRTSFCSLPEFIAEPPRVPCRYYNNDLLDLDEIGRVTLVGLYKGRFRWPTPRPADAQRCRPATLDLAAISHLYKLRVDDLRNTVAQLHSLESALIFLNDVKPALRIDL
jgi:hypothetical protein